MSYTVEITQQLATFQFEVSAESFAHELEKEIFRSKDKLNVSVYRDGKVPPEVLQQMYDRNELLKRVINTVIGIEYDQAMKENNYIALTAPMAKVQRCTKNEPFTFTLSVLLKPEVQVCEYKGIPVPPHNFVVPESDVEMMIQNILRQKAKTIEITDRAVEDGDRVYIDFEGFLHGRAFEGNKANNFPLTIGSKSFIPGFEEEVIGVGINEAKDFNVTYPADYRIETLAGQEVVFRCIVRRITKVEIPELNEEFLKANTKFTDVATYKDSVRKSMELQKRAFEMKHRENLVLKTIIEGSDIEVPEQLFALEKQRVENEQQEQMKRNGVTLERHLKNLGQTPEENEVQKNLLATNRVKTRLLLLEIAQRENLKPTEVELTNEIRNVSKKLNKPEDAFTHPFSRQQIENEIMIQKALRFVMSSCVEVNKDAES